MKLIQFVAPLIAGLALSTPTTADQNHNLDWTAVFPDLTTLQTRFPPGTPRADLISFLHLYRFDVQISKPVEPDAPDRFVQLPTHAFGDTIVVRGFDIDTFFEACREKACTFVTAQGRAPNPLTMGITGESVAYFWILTDGNVWLAHNWDDALPLP